MCCLDSSRADLPEDVDQHIWGKPGSMCHTLVVDMLHVSNPARFYDVLEWRHVEIRRLFNSVLEAVLVKKFPIRDETHSGVFISLSQDPCLAEGPVHFAVDKLVSITDLNTQVLGVRMPCPLKDPKAGFYLLLWI